MLPDIQAVQSDLENNFLALQPAVEKTALALAESDPELMVRYLTDYSTTRGEMVVKRWRELGEYLLTKYNDGYIKNEEGRPENRGYPESWLRKVIESRPDQFRLQKKDAETPESRLED